ncbi:HAD-IC family P-type ATPase [Subtercola endophyticus]|uniref:HAD-IC family P-type ATPase n=1 Tax=Subtercola endophyticus TaxID=2895559 RepID=UPI001E47C63B|nr:HAD-IC family P-type ATPase [Subtercola endophyticus]UFS60230.1 HAD-IC family P-type ATPase [Subtercola endophyticus]
MTGGAAGEGTGSAESAGPNVGARILTEAHTDGLTGAEVAQRIAAGQTNVTHTPTSRSLGDIVRENVFTFFNGILTVCFIAVLLLGDLRDGFFYGVVVFNALIGIVQELRAKRALDKLAVLAAPETAVRRDGVVTIIRPEEVVLGDLIIARPGDQITADAEVVTTTALFMDESLLTGESDPVPKAVGDRLMSGSLVQSGTAEARVVAVGADSYASKLTAEIRRHSLVHSELRAATNRILVYLSWILVPLIIIIVFGRIATYGGFAALADPNDQSWRQALIDAVAGVVGIIPEGLVLLTSLAFGVAAIALSRQKVLVQELAAVEVLARVDVLCLDKTGTLTTGTIGFHGLEQLPGRVAADLGPCRVALAALSIDDAGNATSRALANHFDIGDAVVEDRLAFSSFRAFSAVRLRHAESTTTWLLGAPERLLHGHPEALAAAHEIASSGRRTLVLSQCDLEPARLVDEPELVREATPACFVILEETLRPEAADTLAYFADEGVRVIIVSGDNPHTVASIARQLNLGDTAVDASTLADDDALSAALETTDVFGRVAPEQKRQLVKLLQAQGHSVAMTGDGVNDAMAIKDADLGIAMGNATPATRAVSRLVLLDSRFDRMPEVLMLGRRVIANVERVSNLFLSKTVYGIVLALFTAIFAWEFPFLPRQLTLVSVLAIGVPSFFLALAPNRRRYRAGVLPRVLKFSVPTGLIAATACLTAYAPMRDRLPQVEAKSLATIALFMVSLSIVSVLARPLSKPRVILVLSMCVAFVLAYLLPFTQSFFVLTVTSPGWLLYVIAVGAVGAFGIEIYYRIAKRRGLVQDRE